MPVLVVAGEHDAKFTAIGRRMADAIPDASFVLIEGAGHAAHLERPEQTCAAIVTWLGASSAAERQPEREQRAVGELHPAGRSEHADQCRAAGAVDHRLTGTAATGIASSTRSAGGRQIAATIGECEGADDQPDEDRPRPGIARTARPACACRRPCRSGCRGGC